MNVKPLFYTLIRPRGDRYNNEIKLAGQDFVVNTQIDVKDFHYTNRVGVVVQTPNYPVPYEVGDEVLVHHNTFRSVWNQQGELATSANLVDGNVFITDETQVFAKKVNDKWVTFDKYTLVEPDYDNERHGTVLAGKHEGKKVIFTPSSEYRFDVDGKTFYKMREIDIAAILL